MPARDLIDEFDDERRRLARRLHDAASQQLTALQMDLSLIPTANLPARADKALAEASQLAQSCAREIRAVAARLHPPLLEEAGLAGALRAFAAENSIQLAPDFPEHLGELPPRAAIAAFRIVEAIALNRNSPGDITIAAKRTRAGLRISVDGVTKVPRQAAERIKAMQGKITHGRKLVIEVPL